MIEIGFYIISDFIQHRNNDNYKELIFDQLNPNIRLYWICTQLISLLCIPLQGRTHAFSQQLHVPAYTLRIDFNVFICFYAKTKYP